MSQRAQMRTTMWGLGLRERCWGMTFSSQLMKLGSIGTSRPKCTTCVENLSTARPYSPSKRQWSAGSTVNATSESVNLPLFLHGALTAGTTDSGSKSTSRDATWLERSFIVSDVLGSYSGRYVRCSASGALIKGWPQEVRPFSGWSVSKTNHSTSLLILMSASVVFRMAR